MARILIVEDEARLARLIARVLGEEGYATETVGEGQPALVRALAEPFDATSQPELIAEREELAEKLAELDAILDADFRLPQV